MATEKTYRWHKRGTHKVKDEKRKAFLQQNPQRQFSTVRRCLFGDGTLRAVPLSIHATTGPEAARLFDQMVADQYVAAKAEIARRESADVRRLAWMARKAA